MQCKYATIICLCKLQAYHAIIEEEEEKSTSTFGPGWMLF
ncbi:hypothetical protein GLYMA_02G234150v4 [Glycine max]|nr:hypothetical protein GLYMA_02G234150v4 [Glycine max]